MRHREGDSSAEDLRLLAEGQQWGYSTFHGLFVFLLAQQQDGLQSYDTANKKMKDTQQQCCLIFMKRDVNKMQKQNVTP